MDNESIENIDNSQTFKILCTNYPSEFALDKSVCKDYFRQFGKVKKLVFKLKLRSCTVEYLTEEDYLNALNNAGEYKGQQFNISEVKASPINTKKKLIEKPKVSYIDKDEIVKELAAMGGYAPKAKDTAVPMTLKKKTDTPPKLKRAWKKVDTPTPTVKKKTREKLKSLSQEHLELIRVVKSVAVTAEEKYRVLDARDKLIRLNMKSSVQLKSTPTIGTCPDMCPEKERLMREAQHQVALYEQDDTEKRIMNPNKAVKQYSRSSADQESPLPHELRPVAVLQMTMGYLMHDIMDLSETSDVNIAEWYHFLWDRTRGIRKDITQQALCCQGSVELVEQCARFHIHCSARLVAEDPSVFDQKINTENLTKCLQTLKYMYNDLQLKEESCPNEAEFRAYVILLNLNDSNFMWEVQDLREEIKKSPEVKFALQVYSAFEKRNYVKFFKLIKSTSYLNACILMRYFIQVRVSAIETLLKCFTPPKSSSLYPISELKMLLGFDDLDSTTDFMRTYGLGVNTENTHFVLERRSFVVPTFPYMLERSLSVVESKRKVTVGRTVCGKDLTPEMYMMVLTHETQNSFDKSGYLILDEALSESDLKVDITKEVELFSDNDLIETETKSDVVSISVQKPPIFQSPVNVFSSQLKEQSNDSVEMVNIFGNKPDTTTIFGQKPTAFQSSTSIFGQPKFSENIFKKNESTGSIFMQKAPAENLFTAKALSSNDEIDSSNIFSKPVEISQPSLFAPPKESAKSIFTPAPSGFNIFATTTSQTFFTDSSTPKKGGFKFDLPIAPTTIKENVEKVIFEEKKTETDFSKPDNFSLNLTNRQLEEPPKIPTQFEIETERKRIEDEFRRKKAQEEEQRKQEEERKRMHTEFLEKVKKEKEKERLEEIKRRQQAEEEKKRRENEEERRKLIQLEKERERQKNLEIERTVKDMLNTMVEDVELKIRERALVKVRRNLQKLTAVKVFNQWRRIVMKNVKKRKAMDCSPVWINSRNVKQCADELHMNSEDLTLKYMKRYRFGKPLDIPLIEEKDISSINIYDLTYALIRKRLYDMKEPCQKHIFWKVVISVPDENELYRGVSRIENTLESHINWSEVNGDIVHIEQNNEATFCIQKQKGFKVKGNDANGFIFIAKNFNSSLQMRIFENLKNFGIYTKLPVVIILQEEPTESQEYLDTLKESGIISNFVILSHNITAQDLVGFIEEGLIFLAKYVESSPPLELDSFSSFVTKHLCTEMWKKCSSYAKWNSEYKECMKNPNIVISLYNEGLERLSKIVLDKNCLEYAPFPDVFEEYLPSEFPDFLPCNYRYFPHFWQNPEYRERLKELFKALELPKFYEKWPPESETDLLISLSRYCSEVFKNSEEPFLAVYNALMKNVKGSNFSSDRILWTDALQCLAKQRLKEQNLSLKGTNFEELIYNSFVVVYDVHSLREYMSSDWFYRNNALIEDYKKNMRKKEEKIRKNKKRNIACTDLSADEDFYDVIAKAEKMLRSPKASCVGTQKQIADINRSLQDLEDSISIIKKIDEMHLLKKFISEK